MDKDSLGQVNNEVRGSLANKKHENLEISSTGYGYEAVPQKSQARNEGEPLT